MVEIIEVSSNEVYLSLRMELKDDLENEKDILVNQLNPLREKEAKLNVINNRIVNITKIQGDGKNVFQLTDSVLGKTPINTSVVKLDYNENSLTISFKISFSRCDRCIAWVCVGSFK